MAGSYLGHGAKYWADRYFESQSQTRLPDDSADLNWREKYIALEKSVLPTRALYPICVWKLKIFAVGTQRLLFPI